MHRFYMTVSLVLLCFSASQAAADPLTYKDAPIPPLCFGALDPVEDTDTVPRSVSLEGCGAPDDVIVTGTKVLADGRVETTYRYKEDEGGTQTSSYKVLGSVPEGIAVQRLDNTGGSGDFSHLDIYSVAGDQLTLVQTIAAGDRCSSGVTDARIENGVLVYSVNLTPVDFMAVAYNNEGPAIEAYEDLEASAQSCFGTLTRTGNTITAITLNKDAGQDQSGWTENYTYQACFNQYFRDALKAGTFSFTADTFKSFMDGFVSVCVKQPAAPQ